jgi:type I restriction enzyme M protein
LEAQRTLFDARGFDITHTFVPREHDRRYCGFAPTLSERTALRPLVENRPGVLARAQALREALTAWWTAHAPLLADLPQHYALNRVRAEFLDTFVAALQPPAVLDRFKLAGVIATWWTDTLLDFKTLLENGFPGVIDGWVDAIADAVEDDEAAGPAAAPAQDDTAPQDDATTIRRVLRWTEGNVAQAARWLGVSRKALRYRMERDGIERPRREQPSGVRAS